MTSLLDKIIIGCSALVYVTGVPAIISITQSYDLTCNTFYWDIDCNEEEYYFYRGIEVISRNKSFVLRAETVSGALNNHYFCTVTVNGSNFTSNPVHTPTLINCE